MDNTLKMIVAVLGISGLIAFLTPSGDIVPDPSANPSSVAEAPPPADRTDAQLSGEEDEQVGDDPEDGDVVAFGEPMNDGAPSLDVDDADSSTGSGNSAPENTGSVVQPDAEAHQAAAVAAASQSSSDGAFRSNNPPTVIVKTGPLHPPAAPTRAPKKLM